jgi:hypothetical protein
MELEEATECTKIGVIPSHKCSQSERLGLYVLQRQRYKGRPVYKLRKVDANTPTNFLYYITWKYTEGGGPPSGDAGSVGQWVIGPHAGSNMRGVRIKSDAMSPMDIPATAKWQFYNGHAWEEIGATVTCDGRTPPQPFPALSCRSH